MKLHFRSLDGSILPVAYHCQCEHLADISCSIIQTKDRCRNQYKGILKFYHDNWQQKVNKDTVVIYDQVGNGQEADQLKAKGIPVIGTGEFQDKLELDRKFAMQWMAAKGITIPQTWTFQNYNEAVEFIKQHGKRLVFKASGAVSAVTTYVAQSEDNEDLLYHLEKLEEETKGAEFILQEVVDGIEVSTEVWYYQGKPIFPVNSTFEEKKLMDGNLGPTVGCAGSVVFTWPTTCFIYDRILARLEDDLRREQYTGPLDINCIYVPEENRLYPLEFCSRFGYDAIQNLCVMMDIPLTEVFWRWGIGELSQLPVSRDILALAVRVTQPTAYMEKFPEGEYIGGIPPDCENNCWWSDVMLGSNNQLVTAGFDGNIVSVTSIASTIKECQAKVYAILDKLILSQKQYRTDIGNRFEADYTILQRANNLHIKRLQVKPEEIEPHRRREGGAEDEALVTTLGVETI